MPKIISLVEKLKSLGYFSKLHQGFLDKSLIKMDIFTMQIRASPQKRHNFSTLLQRSHKWKTAARITLASLVRQQQRSGRLETVMLSQLGTRY